MVFGLDAAPPSLLFKEFRDKLPNFSRLMEKSLYGPMKSCDPPITIPAWMVMMTGKEPGELGLYGFRHRKNHDYREFTIPSSRSIRARKVWNYLGEEGYKTFVMGIPPTYPPYPINGWMISGFLTPSSKSQYTYPESLKQEVEYLVGDFIFDVPFRKEDRASVLREIFEMTRQHGKVAVHMAKTKPWNLFIYMEIGLDRIQHAFWKYMDENHPNYTYNEEYSDAILKYYILLDEILGQLLDAAGDDTGVLIVSDHGAKMMKGAFAVNDWLVEQGYLVLKGDVKPGTRLSEADVDWSKTVAWGWGGYYARIFFNVKNREAYGVVEPSEYESVRRELARKIMDIKGPNGEVWKTRVYAPEDIYSTVAGNPPDLMVYFDDLYWRSAGTMGYDDPYLPENDTGPDDAVHDYDGVFIMYNPDKKKGGEVECTIYDVFPTILRYFSIDVGDSLRGEALI